MNILKNCPFCGESSEDRLILIDDWEVEWFYIKCMVCNATGPYSESPSLARELWNDRIGD